MIVHNRYEIMQLLGKGGMGSVYLVKDQRLQCEWAMKQLHENATPMMRKSFQREVELLSKFHYHGFPAVIDCFEENAILYVVMEYIEGMSLLERMRLKKIEDKQLIRWMQELCEHLAYLHCFQPYPIIYLDLKPQNIMVNQKGHIYLLDFGGSCYLDGCDRAFIATPRLCYKSITRKRDIW